jgi:DNA-binding MurR/RpiR family transcriptional regulator
MGKTAFRPESYDDLQKAIIDRFPRLSKRLQQIASYALDNPNEVALETIAAISERAAVQPSSLVRFAKVFGFSGYGEMRRVFRIRLTDAMPDYKERLRSLRGEQAGEQATDTTALLGQFVQADIAGLEAMLQQPRLGEMLDRALKLIADSETVYLVAHRRSFPVCFYLSYALSQMNVRNVLVDGVGGTFFQQVGHATPRDVLLAVSSKAYSPDVVQVVRESSQRGIPVVALTDSPLSPLVEHADVSLEVQQGAVHLFRSLAVPMTLAITLIVGLGRVLETKRNGKSKKNLPKR